MTDTKLEKDLLILIPGNPSVPGIYEPFLNEVVKSFSPSENCEAVVLPHLGQCNKRKIETKVTFLDVLKDHKKTLKSLLANKEYKRKILVGHSLGAAATICLYEDYAKEFDHFVVLCPFMGPSPQNKNYLKLFHHPLSKFGMIKITNTALKSQRLSEHIFRRWLGENPFNSHIPKEIKKPGYINNFFNLVSSYFEDFENLNVPAKVRKMDANKTFFLFAPNDFWVPDEFVHYLPQKPHFMRLENISHDFCLSPGQSKAVAKEIGRYLSPKE